MWDAKPFRRGYCYGSPRKLWKTETVVRKLREGGTGPQVAKLAYELSFRDPALALREVRALPESKKLRLALHHVADAATARELFARPHFDPDALHLGAFAALMGDFLAALPAMSEAEAEAHARKLGFLAGPVPNPLVDGPTGSEAAETSPARYGALIEESLEAMFASPALAKFREEIAEHLRQTFSPRAYRFLLKRWVAGEIGAIAVVAAITRLGWDVVAAEIGEENVAQLARAAARELLDPPRPFEASALDNAWLPRQAKDFPREHALALLAAFVDCPRGTYAAVAREALAELVPPPEAAPAPPDLGLVESAEALLASDVGEALRRFGRVAADPRHPHRQVAFERILALASGGETRIRRHALHQLGELGDARGAAALRAALLDPSLADARLLVETALANVTHAAK